MVFLIMLIVTQIMYKQGKWTLAYDSLRASVFLGDH
jgi:hypothetical protein